MRHFGIIAHPVLHSLSPDMYEAGFKLHHLDADFHRFDVPPEELGTFLEQMRSGVIDLDGCAVSLPHKQACMPLLDTIDRVADDIGAVNTIVRLSVEQRVRKNGEPAYRLTGYNSDYLGVKAALDQALAQNHKRITTLKWKRVLLLGAGGMARACAYVLRDLGAHTFIWNRTLWKARALAKRFDAEVAPDPTDSDATASTDSYDFVIQATSVGLERDESPLPMPFWENHGNGVAIEMIYSPRITRFLRDAERAGWDIIGGEHALVGQALAQFKLLTGKDADMKTFFEAISAKID